MKRILVIDEFENCEDCPLFRTSQDFNATVHYCAPYPDKDLFMVKEKGISKDCPLRPLPAGPIIDIETTKDNIYYYAVGFNDCLDELLGEENE